MKLSKDIDLDNITNKIMYSRLYDLENDFGTGYFFDTYRNGKLRCSGFQKYGDKIRKWKFNIFKNIENYYYL